jgi:biopolymer transport protein ExbD
MTPLIDLTFLLLVTFMITIPLMEYGVNVNPPEMNADKLPDENYKVIKK